MGGRPQQCDDDPPPFLPDLDRIVDTVCAGDFRATEKACASSDRMRAPFLLGLAFTMAPLLAGASVTPDISGTWSRDDGKARVYIAACGAQLCATHTWVRDQSDGEAVGDRLVMTLAPVGNARLAGTAFDVKRNLSYSVQIAVAPRHLRTRGCLIKGILCRTIDWTRVDQGRGEQ